MIYLSYVAHDMDHLRAIQQLLDDADIQEGVYLRVCGHMKKVHEALMSKRPVAVAVTGATQRRCWRCFDFYPDRCRELMRRVAGISEEDAALLTTEQMRALTGISGNELAVEMRRQMILRNNEIRRERAEARRNT